MRCAGGVHVLGQVGWEAGALAQQHARGEGRLGLRQGVGQGIGEAGAGIDQGGAKGAPLIVGDHLRPRIGDERAYSTLQ